MSARARGYVDVCLDARLCTGLHMYVHVRVHVYARGYTCVYDCKSVRVYVCVSVCTYVYECIRVRTCVYVLTNKCVLCGNTMTAIIRSLTRKQAQVRFKRQLV
jgi:hypothetical protein